MHNSAQTGATWIADAEARLQERYGRIRRAEGPDLTPTLIIKPPLNDQEAEYFARGLDNKIFSIDDEGYVQSAVLPPSSRKSTRNKILPLFGSRAEQFRLFREGVCQISTVAALKLKYGCPLEQIQMEPTFPCRPDLAFAIDILLRSPQGVNAAFFEVKRDDSEWNKLISGFQYCCEAGSHGKDKCKFSKNHSKYALCVAIEPEYFIAVSPGEWTCFHLSYCGGVVAIDASFTSSDDRFSLVMRKLSASSFGA